MKTLSSEYLEYIASDEWRRRRALKLLLAGGLTGKVQCELCKVSFLVSRVDVHHDSYRCFKSEPMASLKILCRNCHECIEEIEAMSKGGKVTEMSPQLLETLAMIDKRLGPQPIECVHPPAPVASPKYADTTVESLGAILRRGRLAAGITEPESNSQPTD